MESLVKLIDKKEPRNNYHRHSVANRLYTNTDQFATERPKKKRLLVKKGIENIALLLENIALIYTRHKLVHVVDKFSREYISDKSLIELGKELDATIFFRVNRQHIININFIRSFRSFEKVKLLINIAIPGIKHTIVVSQETAPLFRKWMEEA